MYNKGANLIISMEKQWKHMKITIENSTIDCKYSTSGSVSIINTPKSSFINELHYYETGYCYASPDYIYFGKITRTQKINIYQNKDRVYELI